MTSLEEQLAAFRKTNKPPPELKTYEDDTKTVQKTLPAREPQRPRGPLRTTSEVEDTLYSDFVKADKRLMLAQFIAWSSLFYGAIYVGFGAVFFVISTLLFIWKYGLRQKNDDEASAYSVFNPGVTAIQGSQLTGEQMMKTMGIR